MLSAAPGGSAEPLQVAALERRSSALGSSSRSPIVRTKRTKRGLRLRRSFAGQTLEQEQMLSAAPGGWPVPRGPALRSRRALNAARLHATAPHTIVRANADAVLGARHALGRRSRVGTKASHPAQLRGAPRENPGKHPCSSRGLAPSTNASRRDRRTNVSNIQNQIQDDQITLHEQIRRELARTSTFAATIASSTDSSSVEASTTAPSSTHILYKELSYAIGGAVIDVHRHLGPGQIEAN